MKPEDVPDDLMSKGRGALAGFLRDMPRHHIPLLSEEVNAILAAVLPAHERQVRAQVMADLFGTPEEIAAREAKAAKRKPDDVTEICERAAPGRHERRVRERVAAEIESVVVVAKRDQSPAEAKADGFRAAARIARGES